MNRQDPAHGTVAGLSPADATRVLLALVHKAGGRIDLTEDDLTAVYRLERDDVELRLLVHRDNPRTSLSLDLRSSAVIQGSVTPCP